MCPAHRHEAWTPGLLATPCRMTAAGPGRLLPEPRMMPVRLCPCVFTDRGQRGRSVVLSRETAHPKVPRKCRLGPPGPRALCGGPRHRAGEEDRAQGPAWLPRGRPAPHRTQRWSASWSEPEGARLPQPRSVTVPPVPGGPSRPSGLQGHGDQSPPSGAQSQRLTLRRKPWRREDGLAPGRQAGSKRLRRQVRGH